jgi:hypothetical protein
MTILGTHHDAFDRLRVSNPVTLFELSQIVGTQPFLIDEYTSGSGATQHNLENAYFTLSVAGTGTAIRQTYEYIPYQPGKSKLMVFTGVLNANNNSNNVTTRIGCFDSKDQKTNVNGDGNGCFFEYTNNTLSFVVRNNDDDDTQKINQSAWNYDKFDGTGPSGLTIDVTKALIMAIDQEWLGVGRVRFGFFLNGKFHLAHVFNNSGIGLPTSTPITVPYTKTAKLPIRYEISSNGGSGQLRMICGSVISEGGFEPAGLLFSIGQTAGVTISGANAIPIISICLRETEPYNRKTIILTDIAILNSTNGGVQWDLYLLPNKSSITGGSWHEIDLDNSIAEYNNTSTGVSLSLTGALLLESGYTNQSNSINFTFNSYLSNPIVNSSITGRSRVLCLAGKSIGSSQTLHGSLSWIEVL